MSRYLTYALTVLWLFRVCFAPSSSPLCQNISPFIVICVFVFRPCSKLLICSALISVDFRPVLTNISTKAPVVLVLCICGKHRKVSAFFLLVSDFGVKQKKKKPNQKHRLFVFFLLFQSADSKRTSKRSENVSLALQQLFSKTVSFFRGLQTALCVCLEGGGGLFLTVDLQECWWFQVCHNLACVEQEGSQYPNTTLCVHVRLSD